jgi:hypothetical protein
MDKPSLFIEIFGLDEIAAPPLRDVPSLPTLDEVPEMRDFSKSAGAADDICAQLDRDYLISQLCPVPEEARLEADVRKFSPTPPAAPGLEKIMQEALPTATVLGSWTPVAHQMFGELLKMPRPSRRSENKVCKVELEFNDGTKMCCPEEDDDGNYIWEGKTYRWMDVKTIQTCTHDHQVTA